MAAEGGNETGITVEEFAQILRCQTTDVINSACLLFMHNDKTVTLLNTQITELQKENADLQKENADLRAQLKSNQEMLLELLKEKRPNSWFTENTFGDQSKPMKLYDKGQQFVRETFEKFNNVFGAEIPSYTPEIELPIENGREAVEDGGPQSPEHSTSKGKKTGGGTGNTPRLTRKRSLPSSGSTPRSTRNRPA